MIHVFRIMPKVILKITHAQCDSKEGVSRFFRRTENGTSWVKLERHCGSRID